MSPILRVMSFHGFLSAPNAKTLNVRSSPANHSESLEFIVFLSPPIHQILPKNHRRDADKQRTILCAPAVLRKIRVLQFGVQALACNIGTECSLKAEL